MKITAGGTLQEGGQDCQDLKHASISIVQYTGGALLLLEFIINEKKHKW